MLLKAFANVEQNGRHTSNLMPEERLTLNVNVVHFLMVFGAFIVDYLPILVPYLNALHNVHKVRDTIIEPTEVTKVVSSFEMFRCFTHQFQVE